MNSPEFPSSLEEAFDLKTAKIHNWEVDFIRKAVQLNRIRFDPHVFERLLCRRFSVTDARRVILEGTPVLKDLSPKKPIYSDRKPGINFEGKVADGRMMRVKVSWLEGYVVVTAHEVRK